MTRAQYLWAVYEWFREFLSCFVDYVFVFTRATQSIWEEQSADPLRNHAVWLLLHRSWESLCCLCSSLSLLQHISCPWMLQFIYRSRLIGFHILCVVFSLLLLCLLVLCLRHCVHHLRQTQWFHCTSHCNFLCVFIVRPAMRFLPS